MCCMWYVEGSTLKQEVKVIGNVGSETRWPEFKFWTLHFCDVTLGKLSSYLPKFMCLPNGDNNTEPISLLL